MKVKLTGRTFTVEPETPQELANLLDQANADRAHFGQGRMPAAEILWSDDGHFDWRIVKEAPAG